VIGAMRQFLVVVHRWAALIALAFILILAITGSALVFEGAMDRALYPRLWRVTPAVSRISLDTLIARAHASAPVRPVTGLSLAPAADRAYIVQAGATQVFVDPYTGRVLGQRTIDEWNRTLPRRLHVLHVTLTGGKSGAAIMAIATFVCFALVLTGVYLWWPDKIWRVRWSASWKRVVFDLHHQLGVMAAIVLLLITGSALVMHYETLSRVVYGIGGETPTEIRDQSAPTQPAGAISADSLDAIARHTLPGAAVMFLALPPMKDQPFVAAMRFPEDHTPGGRSRVIVDRYTAAVLGVQDTRLASFGVQIRNQIRSIHTGDWFGRSTEVVWLLATLSLVGQAVTGLLMWWNSRRRRAAKRSVARRTSAALPSRERAPTTTV